MISHVKSTPPSMFRGNELMRLMTMLVMLGVLLLLIVRSGDPNTWAWLVSDSGAGNPRTSSASSDTMNVEQTPKPPIENKSVESNNIVPAGNDKETSPASGGPTDQDPEEVDAIQEQFQAVSDGKINIAPEEMPAYNRLLRWAESQTLAEMRRRAKKDVVFTQFYQSPEKYRGQLFELELNARRILKYEHNDMTLHEVWGWTAESRSWPYVGVVVNLPKVMPIGPDVYEKTTLVGYFFKMQGYMEAGAKPHAAPLQAPLFVGRLIWYSAAKPQVNSSDWSWGIFLLAGFVIFLIIRWWLLLRANRRPSFTPPAGKVQSAANPVDQWLADAESEDKDEL